MTRGKSKPGLEGIETGPLSLPKMDRISMTFALMLDSFTVEAQDDASADDNPVLACNLCGDSLCEVEPGNSLRVLLNTALAHSC